MPRTKNIAKKQKPNPRKQSRNERGESSRRAPSPPPNPPPPRFVNEDATQVYEKFMRKRAVAPERNFAPNREGYLIFDDFVARCGYAHWLNHPDTGYHLELVKEFYANATQATDRRVQVRGVEIVLGKNAFNTFLQTPNPPQCAYHDIVENPEWDDIISELTGGHGEWAAHADGIKKSIPFDQLSAEARVWFYLVASKFMPINHMTEVSIDRAMLMYVLMKGRTVNVGSIVVGSIRHAITYNLIGLPFPQLLTSMLRARGVELATESLQFGKTPITDITIRRIMGLGRQRPRARQPPRPPVQAEEQDHVEGAQVGEKEQARAGPHGVGQVDVLASLMYHMQMQSTMMRGMQSDLRSYMGYMHNRVSRIEEQVHLVASNIGVDTARWAPPPPFPAHFQSDHAEEESPPPSPPHDMEE